MFSVAIGPMTQARAKEAREARRQLVGPSHRYFIEITGDVFGIDPTNLEEFVLDSREFVDAIDTFLKREGPRLVVFHYLETEPPNPLETGRNPTKGSERVKRVLLSNGKTIPLEGTCFYIFKTNKDTTFATQRSFAEDVCYGTLEVSKLQSSSLLKSMCLTLQEVYKRALTVSDLIKKLPDTEEGLLRPEKRAFDAFGAIIYFLKAMEVNISEQVKFKHAKIVDDMEKFKSPYDSFQMAKNVGDVEKVENIIGLWQKQIEKVLAETEQIRKEADDVGPLAELEHWRGLAAKFCYIIENTKEPRMKNAVQVMMAANSKALKPWKDVDVKITDAANEAQDNLKYLYSLEKFCLPLYSNNPATIIETIPNLLNAIRMMNCVSRYYNTTERLAGFFIKVTNQMVSGCKKYIIGDGRKKLWDYPRTLLKTKFEFCLKVYETYKSEFYKTKEKIEQSPGERQFDFSPMYIFGKFEAFCKRLQKLLDVVQTAETFSSLQKSRVEGIDALSSRFDVAFNNFKKKSYDYLDHRKVEFEFDYEDFKKTIHDSEEALNKFMEMSIKKYSNATEAIKVIKRFEKLQLPSLDMESKYLIAWNMFANELDHIRKTYERTKDDPLLARGMPPVGGRVMWARQLFERIEEPMPTFMEHPNLFKTPDGRKLVKIYNATGKALVHFEMVYYEAWVLHADFVKGGLAASLLVMHPDTREILINFDPFISETIREAGSLAKMSLDIPEISKTMVYRQDKLRGIYNNLKVLVSDVTRLKNAIPPPFLPLMDFAVKRLDAALLPGLRFITWTSLSLEDFFIGVKHALDKLEMMLKNMQDIKSARIDEQLSRMSVMLMVDIPDSRVVTVDEFLDATQKRCDACAVELDSRSQKVEEAVNQLISMFLTEAHLPIQFINDLPVWTMPASAAKKDSEELETPVSSTTPPVDLYLESIYEECRNVFNMFKTRNYDALVQATRNSLDAIRKKIQMANLVGTRISAGKKKAAAGFRREEEPEESPLFKSKIALVIPNLVMQPSIDEVQQGISRAANTILDVSRKISQWGFSAQDKKKTQKLSTPALPVGPQPFVDDVSGKSRNCYKLVVEHKDVSKLLIVLSTSVIEIRADVHDVIQSYISYQYLWGGNREAEIQKFVTRDPVLAEFKEEIHYYEVVESEIADLTASHRVGVFEIYTDAIKLALTVEAKTWKMQLGRQLNIKYRQVLESMMDFMTDASKKLQKPIKDLEDVRFAMVCLQDVREKQLTIDMKMGPTEEAYAALVRFGIHVPKDELDLVDTMRYTFNKLVQLSKSVQDHVGSLQQKFRSHLVKAVTTFQTDLADFAYEYDTHGPMEPGIPPREASDRLAVAQARFDDLESKFITYSGGEQLFGMPVTDYPVLSKISKEMQLMQKLYGLFNNVMDSIQGYGEILWTEIDLERIGLDLTDYQAKLKKLPKAMKDWPAFYSLKKKLDDFAEISILLELMMNKAMKERHWERLSILCSHKFEIESENFQLRNILEAPLLKFRDEVEDICISAVKEKDIEAKLKQVIADWSLRALTFTTFKNRGELLLKAGDISETVSSMEDSLMILGSLLSNRYNLPYKKDIQLWIQKLSNTADILTDWLIVQNLWVYLEAVFVGGDIAKQLPKEAKRFQTIDKSWIKIMARAHEIPNVINCCVGDETLGQLLPHLLEQLEQCQKSLTGYLETKRAVFPRFFFISDPALLEILGQASDSHSIQAHLLGVFENVAMVQFADKDYDKIIAVISREKEVIPLEKGVMAKGNVEVWLGELLKEQQRSLNSIVRQAYQTLTAPGFELLPFLESEAAQVGLLGIQILWTREAEESLKICKTDKKIMNTNNQRFLDILNMLIQQTTRELGKFERIKYETLITIHVHQRDIFDELVRTHIKSHMEFEWLKQCRFYFLEEEDYCLVRITDVNFIYQNEYLGCTDRLVITPLTDRCYITLAQAMGMSMGGAPAGPAGTGKTETTKDMGKALGKYVVVFNCSDQMDFRGLGRIFKGLAQSGSWGCFDEFNRIDLPVLSVAAQQVHLCLTAKKERKVQFTFSDGDIVDLNPEFGYFITMNPGYAGRQELPENLKVLFRSVSMMVPDRQIIMRVKLASCGFIENIILAQKFYTLYKLCEEQLTKQVHYDFGLRNILSVLRTLGAQKRSRPGETETTIVMRVLRDMNLSKLVDEDEPLFLSLVSDLFPGIVLDSAAYPDLQVAIGNAVDSLGLINHPPWNLKVIQLFEQQRVRHGMMALGPSGAGKSTCIHTLMRAMTECGEPHREMRMNPKAITAPQMFGRLDVATNDWTDGIFSTLWRRSLKAKKGEHIWIVLDGPVDAVWIENLNSVLDDNKTLTLANGDRIPMSPTCKVVFEPDNIDNASPATVSRNGMVFMSSSGLDWKPILKAWLKTRPGSEVDILDDLFGKLFNDLYNFVRNNLVAKMKVLEANYIKQACNLLEGLIPNKDETGIVVTKPFLEKLFIFAMMWSLGALLELDDRQKMELFIKKHPSKLTIPKVTGEQTVFEFVVDSSGMWEHWNKRVQEYDYPSDHVPEYTSILIPNVDNVRTNFLIDIIASKGKAVLLIGEQGTAKTVMIKSYMAKYDPEVHMSKFCNFSSATTPLMVQRSIESYVDKRMGSTYGPPGGRKMTVFIDDINMPVINEWGDQVTNEIVRQLMENKGFYNLEKPGDFTIIADMQFMAATIHPGGGRNDIPPRLKRQFTVFNCTLPSNASIDKIFGIIGCGYFCNTRFSDEVVKFTKSLVPATRLLWQQVKIKMLPTPAKFHYIFNLRDLSRIWQGMLKIKGPECQETQIQLQLWRHECTRVIADRFITDEDKAWFDECLKKTVKQRIGEVYSQMLQEAPYFVNFLRDAPQAGEGEEGEGEAEAPKIYELVPSFDALEKKLLYYSFVYNETVRGGKMDLVFFTDCMIHLVKISRIISQPLGHALLVGVGGSGKQSLTKLASFIAGFGYFQITLTRTYNVGNLVDDLKNLYRISGQRGKGISFIFTDAEVKDEGYLEYLNNVLSGGEASSLFPRDEMDEILSDIATPMKKEFPKRPPTADNLYEYFSSRSKANLHVVLCFSPVGEKFRLRSLKFPGLISGCTMDWFSKWPRDALVAVARSFLAGFDLVTTPEMKSDLINTMGAVHEFVEEVCNMYFQRFRRATFVTPKSYLSFLNGYKKIYADKYKLIGELAERMNTGLAKLLEATDSVGLLSAELEVKEKELAIASVKADKVLEEVTKSAQAATVVKNAVQKVKDKAQLIVDSIAIEKVVAEEKLKAAEPALAEAEAALGTIKSADIATVRKLGKPPHLIMRIMDCVLILFQRRLEPTQADPERVCPKPSWGDALKLMSGTGFLSSLQNFPKDTINEETVELMGPYLEMEDYNLETARKVCGNVAGLLSWTISMSVFFGINREVLPLKANLIVQEARLQAALAELNTAQAQLDEKQREFDAVQAMYDAAMKEKQDLLDDAETCKYKMVTASALINGLSGERMRWTEQSKLFKSIIDRLVGDVLILAGFLSYSGPFNQEYRTMLFKGWQSELFRRKVFYTPDLNLTLQLTDIPTIGEWNLQGLPNDELSVQNGIIVTQSPRYPLLIDPQGQGKYWISNKEREFDLMTTSLQNKYFRNHLEDALALGRPLLIEDLGEELDPALDNVLEKNFIKSGRTLKVKVGDKECDVLKGFSLVLTTKLANPRYTPETSAKTSIIDFTVTMKGLEDQLLGRVIMTEKAELEIERKKLLEMVTSNKRKMQDLEDNLLYKLTSTQGSLVEDVSLLAMLAKTKETAAEVKEKLAVAADTEIRISVAREEFRPVAARGSILYFLICEMTMVNFMYQTSLKQFLSLFDFSMAKSEKSPLATKRMASIIDYFTFEIFRYTSRLLYEKDKFLFLLLLGLKIDMSRGFVKYDEFQCLLKGGAALDLGGCAPKPARWITDVTWLNLVELSKLAQFHEILSQVQRGEKAWRNWFDKDAPEEEIIPDNYSSTLDTFRKLLLVRAWCPDRTMAQSRKYVADSLGKRYADPVILNLEATWAESDSRTPLICLLSMGSDPTQQIDALSRKLQTTCQAISMGQGQEIHARKLVSNTMANGGWTLLQNCHLGLLYMEELLETVMSAEHVHDDFRVWLTTEPHAEFSISLLQVAIKFTNQPPEGMKAGLLRTYVGMTQEQLDYSDYPQWKPMLYAISFMHTCVQERRKYGPLGWNIPYEFNSADYSSTVQFIMNHLDDMDPKKGVSWTTVRYMIGEVQYGGRVTDDYDKRLLNTYARVWFGEHMFPDSFAFYKEYKIPKVSNLDSFIAAIEILPDVDSPLVFGLHSNADITYQTNTAKNVFDIILSIQPKESSAGGGETRESVVYRMAEEMLDKMPSNYVPHEVKHRLEKMGLLNSLNIFLKQEVDRMQKVITIVRITLSDLKLAIDGTIIMSENLREALDKIFDARVPDSWKKVSWDSTSIGFWFTDLLDRNEQFFRWLFSGRPMAFWMTGFFNPQGFLTAMRQEVTRMHKGWALDSVTLHNEVTKNLREEISAHPAEGVYIYGLFLDGAAWDRKNVKLMEQSPKVLQYSLPVVHMFAVNSTAPKDPKLYQCPVYKKPRRTDLTYITPIWLKTSNPPEHWILRAVALLCDTK